MPEVLVQPTRGLLLETGVHLEQMLDSYASGILDRILNSAKDGRDDPAYLTRISPVANALCLGPHVLDEESSCLGFLRCALHACYPSHEEALTHGPQSLVESR